MGTFAEKAIVDCRLPFDNQGKENFSSPFFSCWQQANGSLPFPFPVFRLQLTNRNLHFLLIPFFVY
jgi:hypothetical protein